jgi:hypothetical protein
MGEWQGVDDVGVEQKKKVTITPYFTTLSPQILAGILHPRRGSRHPRRVINSVNNNIIIDMNKYLELHDADA